MSLKSFYEKLRQSRKQSWNRIFPATSDTLAISPAELAKEGAEEKKLQRDHLTAYRLDQRLSDHDYDMHSKNFWSR